MPLTFTSILADDTLAADIRPLVLEISRELKEALRTIRCCAELAEDKWESSGRDTRELLQCISGAGVRIQNLIDDALALAIGSAAEESRFEMDQSLQCALIPFKQALEETGARVRSRKLPTVTANFEGLSRVFQTLLANAIQYRSERQPWIQVDCARRGEDWLVSVADNGIGIKPEHREVIFEAFRQADSSTTRQFGGTGLGLTISARLVGMMGGTISVDSTFGKGSEFRFSIPCKLAPRDSVSAPARSVTDVPAAPAKRLRILLAEDNTINQQIAFARLGGVFAFLALAIAGVGLYGTMSYNVARRTNEIGIRMALGARQGRVIAMVMSEVLTLIAVGLALGIPVALATSKFVASFLYGMKPNDPLTLGIALGALIAAGLVAAYAPARRASRIDPMAALRHE